MRKKLLSLVLSVTLAVGMIPWTSLYPVQRVLADEPEETEMAVGDEGGEEEPEIDCLKLHRQELIDEAKELGVPDAFIRHNFAEDYDAGKLEEPAIDLTDEETQEDKAPKVTVKTVTNSASVDGLVYNKVDTGVLARTRIDLGEFDFGDMKVGHLVYNMWADKKSKGTAYLYFGDSEEPFTSISIRRTADEDWGKTSNCTVDVSGKELTGSGHVYMNFVANSALDGENKVIPNSGVKGSLFLESMFFTEGSTPVVEFDLDKEINTIENINGSELHTTMGYGSMNIDIPEGYDAEYTDDELKDATYELDYIRGRGNSTWLKSKKPYKVKLDKSADLFGMGKSKHWVLLANYYDYSLIRNKMTFYLADKLGMEYTPKSVCVDVVISGEYYGSYQLSQQVRIGANNVAIDDLEDKPASAEPEITGGYLLSLGSSWLTEESETAPYIDANGYSFKVERPEYDDEYPEEAKEAQLKYLERYMTELGLLVESLNPVEEEPVNVDNPGENEDNNVDEEVVPDETSEVEPEETITIPEGKTWRDYMDEQSMIDYYLLQEFSKNGDAYGSSSTYLYKKRDGKLYWGPVWDFDFVAWGAFKPNYISEGNLEKFEMIGSMPWFETLISNDEAFKKKVIERWKVLKDILEKAVADNGVIDQYKDQLYYSALANYQVNTSYLIDGVDYWSEGTIEMIDDDGEPYTLNYTNEIDRLKKFISSGIEWLDANIETIDEYQQSEEGSYPPVPFYVDGELVKEVEYDWDADGLKKEDIPEPPVKEGMKFKGWYYIDEEGVERRFAEKDSPYMWDLETREFYACELHAKYVPLADYAAIQKIVPCNDTLYVPLYMTEYYDEEDNPIQEYEAVIFDISQYVSVVPFEADPDEIDYYDEDNYPIDNELWISSVGERTITCRAGEAECKINIVAYDADSNEVEDGAISVAESVTMKVGEYGDVNFAFVPAENQSYDKYYDIVFTTVDSDIAEVSVNGIVYAKKPGKTRIITIQKNGRNVIKKYTDVTVTDENGKLPEDNKEKETDKTDDKPDKDDKSNGETSKSDNAGNKVVPGDKDSTGSQPTGDTSKNANKQPATTTSTDKVTTIKEPAKAEINKVYSRKKTSKKLKIKLNKADNANGYEVSVYGSLKNAKNNKKALIKKTTTKQTVTISSKKLKNKKKLYIKVRAYNKQGNTISYGQWSAVKKVKCK